MIVFRHRQQYCCEVIREYAVIKQFPLIPSILELDILYKRIEYVYVWFRKSKKIQNKNCIKHCVFEK